LVSITHNISKAEEQVKKLYLSMVLIYFLSFIAVGGNKLTDSVQMLLKEGFENWQKTQIGWKSLDPEKKRDIEVKVIKIEEGSGGTCLLISDRDSGNYNDGIYWALANKNVKEMRGDFLRLSAKIRQTWASAKNTVGIGYWIKCEGGKTLKGNSGPDRTGATGWADYILEFQVPKDAVTLLIFINCCHKWGQTGEAYFDDILLQRIIPQSVKKGKEADNFYIFKNQLHGLRNMKSWKGLYVELVNGQGRSGKSALRIKTVKGAKKYAGVTFFSPSVNRRLDFSALPLKKTALSYWIKPFHSHLLTFGKRSITVLKPEKTNSGWSRVKIPFPSFLGGPPALVDKLSFQLINGLTSAEEILLDDISVSSPSARFLVETKGETESISKLKKMTQELEKKVFKEDGKTRPEIKNGTFYLNGKPVFMLGPWVSNGSLKVDWGPGTERECMRGEIYDAPFCRKTADILGMNSCQLSAAPLFLMEAKHGLPLSTRDMRGVQLLSSFMKNLKGMPFVLDFAWMKSTASKIKAESLYGEEIFQQNPDWHSFIPFCPEHPEGDRLLQDYFRTGTAFALANEGNPFVYELFNESVYNCRCQFNRRNFAIWAKKRYLSIKKANTCWSTVFKNFKEASEVVVLEKYPGLWVDWCKFSGERYAQILQRYQDTIREVDQRERVYFCEQLIVPSITKYYGTGMDYRKIAEVNDILVTEGGWQFGSKAPKDEKDAMAAALSSSHYPFVLDFFRALGKGKKPVLNNEHYCGRFRFGKRVPSKKMDIVTAMWGEVFHGASGAYPYAWCKRIWEWKNFEQAKKMVYNGGYKSYHFLNPYAWPREAINGFLQFSDEINQLAELALPMPRLAKAKVGLVYSYPSIRMSPITKLHTEERISHYYDGLLYQQYPVEVVFEKDLKDCDIRKYEALVFPISQNVYADTLPVLEKYVRQGGTVFCDGPVFSRTEYGKPLDASQFLGLERGNGGTVTLKNATQLPKLCSGLSSNKIGKGAVYYFSGKNISSALSLALKDAGIGRYAKLQSLDELGPISVEFQVIDRGAEKLLYFINWADRGTRLVNVKLDFPGFDQGFIYEPFGKTMLVPDDGKTWTAGKLQTGFPIILPSQERVLLLLSKSEPEKNLQTLTPQQNKARFSEIRKQEAEELQIIDEEARRLKEKYKKSRIYTGVNQQNCFAVDLRKQVNMGFKDDNVGDKTGGWFDQGGNDYRNIPLGKQVFANVPFDIIDPAKNNGKSVIVLQGTPRPYFPDKFEGIGVNSKAKYLYFLHTAGWGAKKMRTHSYYIQYQDGLKIEIPIHLGAEIGGWWKPNPIQNGKIAHESSNLACNRVGLYCTRWKNPYPDKIIKTIDIISSNNKVVPAVVAITAEKF
jgi:glycosyl hydrolase family 42 (putative beta-galactosidase)